jgi:hypothetical protein
MGSLSLSVFPALSHDVSCSCVLFLPAQFDLSKRNDPHDEIEDDGKETVTLFTGFGDGLFTGFGAGFGAGLDTGSRGCRWRSRGQHQLKVFDGKLRTTAHQNEIDYARLRGPSYFTTA